MAHIEAPHLAHSRPPFLRWAGSKRQILPILAKYWNNNFKRYVEPFAGSACLFFHLAPPAAILGDINSELIHTFRCLRRHYPEISKKLDKMKNTKSKYYQIRALRPNSLPPPNRAARFIYLNRYCFNGIYRTNSHGSFNVPYGGHSSGSLPSEQTLKHASWLLERATLMRGDFEKVLDRVALGDFVYMDPPFTVRDKRIFKEYNPSAFSMEDITRLRKRMEGLARMRIPFVVSYVESEEAEYLSRGFSVSRVSVRRNIAGFLASRMRCNELLISNSA